MTFRQNLSRARRAKFESLEQRNMLAVQPILTEFVASNDTTLNDGFGQDSDWIEIYNAGNTAIDLQGYHLTDDSSNTTKWSFSQPTILGAKDYLVVFASDEDTIDPAGYWHTNFKLSAGGEYAGLADPAGTIISDFGLGLNEYPNQVTDISYGLPGPIEQTLLATTDNVDYLVPSNGSLGTSWTNVGFNAAANGFSSSSNGLGYENDPGSPTSYSSEINTTLPSGTTTTYIRSEFNLTNTNEVVDLSLALTFDDGFAVYLNGTYLFGENEPATALAYNSAADGYREDSQVLSGPVIYSLNSYTNLLQTGVNVLAIHALNDTSSSDMLLAAELSAKIGDFTGSLAGYLTQATPGAANSDTAPQGPIIRDFEFTPEVVGASSTITVTADISTTEYPVDFSSPKFYYRVNFGSEIEVPFLDNGLGADENAGDGTHTAQIPSAALSEGDMVRWYMTAADSNGTLTRAPRFADPLDSAEYFGTVILDSTASDDVPVLYWFVEDEAAAETREGTRASIFYRGDFYDNIQVDLHGQSTSLPEFIKKSFDFDANLGEKFDIGDDAGKHSDFNLLTNYADQSKLRHTVAYAAFNEVGGAYHLAHPVSVHRNGDFYGLYDFIEEGDSEYLRRLGLDIDGALYKVNNDLENNSDAAFNEVDKLTRTYEDRSDFQEVIDADDLTGNAARAWYFDNLDIADIINYAATQNVIRNMDFGHKNMYWYRDSNNTKLWQVLPWDEDLSFGHQWIASTDPPYFDNTLFTDGLVGGSYMNDILIGILGNSGAGTSAIDGRFTDMLKRRTRSITDQLLGLPGTAASESWVYQEFQKWEDLTADEAIQDLATWGIHPNFTHTPAQAVNQIQNSYVVARRNFLNGFAGSQSNAQNISIGTIEFAPSSGNQDEEYIALINNNPSFAADLSNWTLSGAIEHTFKPGTVIPAGETLYVLADVQGFQARTTGPQGGQQLFTQGNYTGRLSNAGGSLVLANATGAQIDTASFVGTVNNGDFDDDGDFDGSDFLAWQRGFGITSGATPNDGDADEDGAVNEVDLSLWTNSYFMSSNGTSGSLAGVQSESPGDTNAADSSAELAALVVFSDEFEDETAESLQPTTAYDQALANLQGVLPSTIIASTEQDQTVYEQTAAAEQSESDEIQLGLEELYDAALNEY